MAALSIIALPEDVLRRIFGQHDEKGLEILDTQYRCVLRIIARDAVCLAQVTSCWPTLHWAAYGCTSVNITDTMRFRGRLRQSVAIRRKYLGAYLLSVYARLSLWHQSCQNSLTHTMLNCTPA